MNPFLPKGHRPVFCFKGINRRRTCNLKSGIIVKTQLSQNNQAFQAREVREALTEAGACAGLGW